MSNLSLFPEDKLELTKADIVQAKENAEDCYNNLRGRGFQPSAALWFIIEQNLEMDFRKLWDEFERDGKMTYLKINLFGEEYEVWENDISIYFEDRELFYWSSDDCFDAKGKSKLKKKIKDHVFNNIGQFNLK